MLGNKSVMAYNIQRFMKETGIRGVDIARKLGIPKTTVSSWTNAVTYPRIERIEELAKLFGCTKADLIEEPSALIHQYELTEEEFRLVDAYRNSDEETKAMIKRLLQYVERSDF